MTQKQKQRLRAKQPELAGGVRAIAILDLVIGVPLALGLLVALLKEPTPRDWAGYSFGALMFLLVFGFNGAGACLLLRHHALARALQWIPTVIMLVYLGIIVFLTWRNGLGSLPPLLIVGALLIALITLTLPLLLRKLTED
jgi:hypothetical protein